MKPILLTSIFAALSAPLVSSAADAIPMPDQAPLAGPIVKFHKGVTQGFFERYVPGLQCRPFAGEVLCMAKVDELSSLFVRNARCLEGKTITFTVRGSKAVAVSCHVDGDEAKRLGTAYGKRFGAPVVEQKDVPPMLARQQSWKIGDGDVFMITHFYGNNIRSEPINDFVIRMGPER